MIADNLENLLDSLKETSVYVIEEETHRLLYCNQCGRETGKGIAVLGVKCHEVWPERCRNCPLSGLKDRESSRTLCYDPLMKIMTDVTANRIGWEEGIRAVAITSTPHRMSYEEKQGIEKIERMYAQSLVTVFDECVIVNLTDDYYVNCQKDDLWTDIPEQGNFAEENRTYAKKVIHPDDQDAFYACFSREAMLQRFGEGKKQISKRLRRRTNEGTYHIIEFTAARIEQADGEECWCVLVYRDIQEEYLLEQQRKVESSQLATAARIAYQMLIAVNLTQNVYHMLEYERFPVKEPDKQGTLDELIEFELSTVHPDYKEKFAEKFRRPALIKAFSGGERLVEMRVPHLGEDGVYHWNFTQVVRVESPYTEDMIEITLSRNVDEEQRLQEERLEKERQAKQILEDALQKAEKASQAKSDFLSRMSHDIRTPMNAILGITELAQLHINNEEKLKDYLGKIEKSGKHLLGLINEVLDVSKIESGTVELVEKKFDLRGMVKDIVEMVRLPIENKSQLLTVHVEEGIHAEVSGDERRLRQVLVNILENASKYTKEEGKIVFSLEELKKEEQMVGTYRFTVEDTGAGMKKEYLSHIFEPFSRADDSRIAKVTGTGLGMTIVKNIISMMGGNIQVESEYGKGSRFVITLCMNKCDEKAIVSPPERLKTEEAFSELRVLLAEDNELNAQIATEMLGLLGVAVETVENGQKAVEAVCAHPPFYYDVVFMDVQMPVMNGYDASREIRNSGIEKINELPIIAMTADAFTEDIKRARLAGMSGHLAKPISIEQLKDTLSRCLFWKKEKHRDKK